MIINSDSEKEERINQKLEEAYEEVKKIDEMLEKVGFGSKQMLIIFLASYQIFMAGVQSSVMQLILIPFISYFNASATKVQWASANIFIGLALGNLSILYLAKNFDRILVIILSMIFVTFLSFIQIFNTNIYVFIIIRIFIGICNGISNPLITNVLVEYVPMYYRGFAIIGVWASSNISQIYNCIVMLIIMPNFESDKLSSVFLLLWIPQFILTFICIIFLRESPRKLILSNKKKEIKGIKIIVEMLNEKHIIVDNSQQIKIINYIKSGDNLLFETNVFSLFQQKFLKITLLQLIIWIIDAMVSFGPPIIYTPTLSTLSISPPEIISSSILAAVCSSIGLFIAAFMSDMKGLGIKNLSIISFLLSIIFVIFIIAIPSHYVYWYSFYIMFAFCGFNVSTAYATMLYPTKIRDMAIGFLNFSMSVSGCLSQFIFLNLFSISFNLIYIFIIVITLINIICIFLLPYDVSNIPLDREFDEKIHSK